MDQQIAKGDDFTKIGNTLCQRRVQLRDPAQGFSDDLEFPLDGGMDELAFGIGVDIEPCDEPKDRVGCLLDVPQKGARITLQR